MKKNVFLTGDIQVGKSTIIKKYLAARRPVYGGFCTLGGNYQPDGSSGVYIFPAAGEPVFREENCVFWRIGHRAEGGIELYPEVFDTLGVRLLETEPDCRLLVMDELGALEAPAEAFCAAVLAKLDGPLPILGVAQPKDSPLLRAVRAHPDTELVEVTAENREAVLARLLEEYIV